MAGSSRTTVEGSVLILTVLGLIWTFGRHLAPLARGSLDAGRAEAPRARLLAVSPGIGNWFRARRSLRARG